MKSRCEWKSYVEILFIEKEKEFKRIISKNDFSVACIFIQRYCERKSQTENKNKNNNNKPFTYLYSLFDDFNEKQQQQHCIRNKCHIYSSFKRFKYHSVTFESRNEKKSKKSKSQTNPIVFPYDKSQNDKTLYNAQKRMREQRVVNPKENTDQKRETTRRRRRKKYKKYRT